VASAAGHSASSVFAGGSPASRSSGVGISRPCLATSAIARAQLARRQSGERIGIGQHDPRLVEGAGQVLARAGGSPRSCRRPRNPPARAASSAPARRARRASPPPRRSRRCRRPRRRRGPPVARATGAIELLIDAGAKIDHRAAVAKASPIIRIQHGTAPGCDHPVAEFGQRGNRFFFTFTKAGLAFPVKNIGNIHTGTSSRSRHRSRETFAPSIRASCRPTAVLPAPMGPIR
jgi:hypothetical protein